MAQSQFVIVSNRLPVTVHKDGNGLHYEVSSGGLATAMSSLNVSGSTIWIGWPGISADEITATERASITRQLKKHNCYPVYLTQAEIEGFYHGYSNDTLWPLFHYFQSYTSYSEDYWAAYQKVNKTYASAIKRYAEPNATIWIHDYHLMLLPAMIRQHLPESLLGFFLHIPFPSYEIFRLLPERKELLEGLLGADLIGFHTYDYVRHFLSSCLRSLGISSHHGTMQYESRAIKVDAFPIGIDYNKFQDTLKDPETQQEALLVCERYKGQKIILSVDRLDYSKGILQRLEAFDLLLATHPEYIEKVALVVVAVPSRTEVGTYKNLRDSIEQAVSRINGKYGTVKWAPISYQFQNLPFKQVVALYAEADVALVTPLRDGMNLIAKEYVASKKNRSGVLILSEMAGAIDELPEALSINPNDAGSIVKALQKALKMPKKEQLSRLEVMQKRIASYTVQKWGKDFVDELEGLRRSNKTSHGKQFTKAAGEKLLHDFKSAKKRLILLDYDGTIQNFKSTPKIQHARPSRKLRKLLVSLAQIPHTKLSIISGRSKKALETWFGKMPISLVAEHGAWVKYNDTWITIETSFNKDKKRLLPIMKKYADRTAGALIEEKDFALVWHYRKVPAELAYIRTANLRRELQAALGESDVGIFTGNKVLEVKLKDVHKGYAAAELSALYPADFILAIGDDDTDEDMFQALPEEAYTIKVGSGETHARLQVPSVEKIIALLAQIDRLGSQ